MPVTRSDTQQSMGSLSITEADGEKPKEKMVTQIVTNKYIQPDRLQKYLEKRFPGKWKVKVKLGIWEITVPEEIPEDDLNELC